jgi:hypothetical protein
MKSNDIVNNRNEKKTNKKTKKKSKEKNERLIRSIWMAYRLA